MVRWRAWLPVVVVLAAAVALWFISPDVGRMATSGWTYLGWGVAFALTLVASSSYRSRRDPSVLFVAAGVAALVGRRQAQEVTPAAPRTVETVKADIQELKDARHGTP